MPATSTPTCSWSRSAPTSIPAATPGLVEGGHEFYTVAGAFALRDVLADFAGGQVVVGRDLDPVQVPAGPERDGAADARPVARQGPARAFARSPW